MPRSNGVCRLFCAAPRDGMASQAPDQYRTVCLLLFMQKGAFHIVGATPLGLAILITWHSGSVHPLLGASAAIFITDQKNPCRQKRALREEGSAETGNSRVLSAASSAKE